jgi:uncharacterized protein
VGTTDELFVAIAAGDATTMVRLLETDPSLATSTSDGVGVLRTALYTNNGALVPDLLGLGAMPDAFDAAALGDEDLLRQLIERDPSVVTEISTDGFSALHLAAFFGHSKAAGLLVAKGADPECVATSGSRLRPLHSAAAGGHEVIAHLLLDRGVDIEAQQTGGYRPLHSAANRNDLPMMRLLLGRGADPAAATDDGRTARTLATDPAALALLPPDSVGI